MMKKIALLGSTGSIGKQTLEIARHLREEIKVVALAAKNSVDLIEEQAKEFSPEIVCLFEEKAAKELKIRNPGWNIVSGIAGLCEVAAHSSADLVILAMVGSQGILPALEAAKNKKQLALANKEILVAAGECITRAAKEAGIEIFPLDSEHSAIFQCLIGEKRESIKRLVLTASGGPFLHKTEEDLLNVTPEDAAKHPNWNMGKKVSIDCSTLMNKGFEVIEAKWLFDIPVEQIDVLIHPQSIVHSMVEFIDGSVIAQMGKPNMILPIQFALTYPERRTAIQDYYPFHEDVTMQFYKPDFQKFKCLELAYASLREGGTLPCVLNAANEVLVDRFCLGEISWVSIPDKLRKLVESHTSIKTPTIDVILQVDRETRLIAQTI